MQTPEEVLIAGERHLIIHGQIGNLQAKTNELEHYLCNDQGERFLQYLAEIKTELDFLKKYYPKLDGGIDPIAESAGQVAQDTPPPEFKLHREQARLRNALRDMRALMDAAQLSYTHEGVIACHLKVMLDDRWNTAAEIAGIDVLNDPPF